jgi:hypothetical protein
MSGARRPQAAGRKFTLQQVADQINAQITGAAASVDSGGRLVITSSSTGTTSSTASTAPHQVLSLLEG